MVYVTLNQSLKRSVEEKMTIVGITGFEVIEEKDLWETIDLEYRFVFDEYHAALTQTKVEFRDKVKINPIFLLGHTKPVIMSTAHESKQFYDFMRKYFPKEQLALYQHGSIMGMAGKE